MSAERIGGDAEPVDAPAVASNIFEARSRTKTRRSPYRWIWLGKFDCFLCSEAEDIYLFDSLDRHNEGYLRLLGGILAVGGERG